MLRFHLSWQMSSWLLALLLVSPIVSLVVIASHNTDGLFAHLMDTVLPTYFFNSLLLVFGTVLLCSFWGVSTAWLMAMCQFPSSQCLQWALVLPMAMPPYLLGYIVTDWLDFAGPVQVGLRAMMGWQAGEYFFIDMRTLWGAMLTLSLALYPYVYLFCRTAFAGQSAHLLQVARLLGCSPWQSFIRVSLPLLRPALAVSLALVAIETLGDYATVSYFAVNTLTTAVYDTWLGYSSLSGAARISLIMLILVMVLVMIESHGRHQQRLILLSTNKIETPRLILQGGWKWVALIGCWSLVGIAFLLPVLQLFLYSFDYFSQSWSEQLTHHALNSVFMALLTALIALLLALVLNINVRFNTHPLSTSAMRLASLGYAIPATVMAIGVLAPSLLLDRTVNALWVWLDKPPPGLLFSGSLFVLIWALVVRFLAIAVGSIESAMSGLSSSLDMAAKTLGHRNLPMFFRVHLPLIRRGVLIAFLLVFIESMKELNATLLLRPFNFETLATYVYGFASDEQLELAALPALFILVLGLVPLLIINRLFERRLS